MERVDFRNTKIEGIQFFDRMFAFFIIFSQLFVPHSIEFGLGLSESVSDLYEQMNLSGHVCEAYEFGSDETSVMSKIKDQNTNLQV